MNYFWELTPKQFEKHIEVYIEKEKERAKELDYNNFLLGRYLIYAFNDPKKYPKKPFLLEAEEQKKKESQVMTDDEMARQMKKNFILFMGMKAQKQKPK